MRRSAIFVILFLITSISIVSLAQDNCPALIELALNSTDEFCKDTGRNQACFGHVNLTAEGQPDADGFEFIEVGDIVDVASISSLRLSTLDTSAGAWGVVMMRIQANLPDSIPGQNVTFMLFGDTEIRNAATSVAEQEPVLVDVQISSSSNANVRVGPKSTMAVIASIPNGTDVKANGISPDAQWLRIEIPQDENFLTGWISTQLIRSNGDFSTLKTISPSQPQFGPMQAFYLTTGIGQSKCNEAPKDGLLVQTPKGLGEINLLVNEVEISMGSTVFFSAPSDNFDDDTQGNTVHMMNVKTIEGAAKVTSNGREKIAVAGSEFDVMYNDEGEFEDFGDIESYEVDEVNDLPYNLLEREIEVEAPLSDEEIEAYNQYEGLLDLVELDDTNMILDYLAEYGDDDVIGYMQDELGYDYFDGELAGYLEEDLGLDVEGYGDQSIDDFTDDNFDDFSDDNFDDFSDDNFDDFSDDNFDDFSDDNFDDFNDDSGDDFNDDSGGDDFSDDGGDDFE